MLWFLRLFPQFREAQAGWEECQAKLRDLTARALETSTERDKWRRAAVEVEQKAANYHQQALNACNVGDKLESELATVRDAYNAEVQDHIRTKDRLDAATQETKRVWEIAQKCRDVTVALQDEVRNHVETSNELTSVRDAYNAEVQDHIRTKDRLDAATQETKRVWEIAQKAIDGERFSYQSQINHLVQAKGGGAPYAEAHALPENAVPKAQPGGPVGRAGRMLPSQQAAMAQRAAMENIVEEIRHRVEG